MLPAYDHIIAGGKRQPVEAVEHACFLPLAVREAVERVFALLPGFEPDAHGVRRVVVERADYAIGTAVPRLREPPVVGLQRDEQLAVPLVDEVDARPGVGRQRRTAYADDAFNPVVDGQRAPLRNVARMVELFRRGEDAHVAAFRDGKVAAYLLVEQSVVHLSRWGGFVYLASDDEAGRFLRRAGEA